MIFWLLASLMSVGVLAFLLGPLGRDRQAPDTGPADAAAAALLNEQLRAVERDVEEGRIEGEEAEAARTEVKRRVLKARRAQSEAQKPLGVGFLGGANNRRLMLLMVGIAIPLIGLLLYLPAGKPDQPGAPLASREAELAAAGVPTQAEQALVRELAERMQKNPADPEGWALLGGAYQRQGRYDDAVQAFANAVERKPDSALYLSGLGEALVQQAGGEVTDQASFAFESALSLDAADFRARYFLALDKAQAGDLLPAYEALMALLADAPPDAPWREGVKAQIAHITDEMARQLEAIEAVEAAQGGARVPAPDSDAAAAIAGLDDASRDAAIRSMVARLDSRLKDDPSDLQGWLRLATSYSVLGEVDKARAALDTASTHFAGDFAALAQIADTRTELGLTPPASTP